MILTLTQAEFLGIFGAGSDLKAQLTRIEALLTTQGAQLTKQEREIQTIMATEAEVKAALDKIDAATTKIGSNLTVISGTITTIGTEVDALVDALKNAGVPQAILDQATALGVSLDAASNALDAQVPVLNAIAAKGVINPVPVPPPA
jgi:chromosome segregation ATPase